MTWSRSARTLAFYPVIAGGKVIVADARYVTAYDLQTGASEEWFDAARDNGGITPILQLPAPADLRYTVTVAGDCVYARLGEQAIRVVDEAAPAPENGRPHDRRACWYAWACNRGRVGNGCAGKCGRASPMTTPCSRGAAGPRRPGLYRRHPLCSGPGGYRHPLLRRGRQRRCAIALAQEVVRGTRCPAGREALSPPSAHGRRAQRGLLFPLGGCRRPGRAYRQACLGRALSATPATPARRSRRR